MSRRKKHHYRSHHDHKCSYCGKNMEGMVHKCKFCGDYHCSNHLLPEDHKCQGVKQYYERSEKWMGGGEPRKPRRGRQKSHSFLDEGLDFNILPTTKKEKVSHKRKKQKEVSFKFLIFLIFMILVYVLYANWAYMTSVINYVNLDEEVATNIDASTLKAFAHINEYRSTSGSQNLTYVEELYEIIKKSTKEKDLDPNSFEDTTDFNSAIASQFNISSIKTSYYKTYFIQGGGIEKFSEEFDKGYSARNIIKNNKYG